MKHQQQQHAAIFAEIFISGKKEDGREWNIRRAMCRYELRERTASLVPKNVSDPLPPLSSLFLSRAAVSTRTRDFNPALERLLWHVLAPRALTCPTRRRQRLLIPFRDGVPSFSPSLSLFVARLFSLQRNYHRRVKR